MSRRTLRTREAQGFERTSAGPRVYGHRGARARAPDNSLEAFQLAMDEGADGLELDVRMTADAQLVIYHDAALDVKGQRHEISELTLGQLQRLVPFPLLTLADVLAFRDRSGALLNVELKGDVPSRRWMAEASCRLLRRSGPEHILISSFHADLLWWVTRELPDVPTGLLLSQRHRLTPRLLSPVLRALGASAVHPELALVSKASVSQLSREGFLVNVWTVNEPADVRALSTWGVDGIITDRPREALAVREEVQAESSSPHPSGL